MQGNRIREIKHKYSQKHSFRVVDNTECFRAAASFSSLAAGVAAALLVVVVHLGLLAAHPLDDDLRADLELLHLWARMVDILGT